MMPWRYETVSQTRKEFVERVLRKEKSKSALCREYGISRPTGDKWINRYLNGESLDDRSRKPFKTANKISEDMECLIVSQRHEEPAIGAVKIHKMLTEEGVCDLPSVSTINNVLHRNGLITKAASQAATPYKRFEKENPNDMWQADFKGNYRMQNGLRCHPLSIIDDCTRYCLCADAKENERLGSTYASFEAVFREFGLPKVLLCDNGNPWGASQSTAITKFEVRLMELGILTIHIRAVHPQTQGKVERFNRSFKNERLRFHTPKDIFEAQEQRLEYRKFYNNKRPHFALNLDTPASHYKHSEIKYPEKLRDGIIRTEQKFTKLNQADISHFKGKDIFLVRGLQTKK